MRGSVWSSPYSRDWTWSLLDDANFLDFLYVQNQCIILGSRPPDMKCIVTNLGLAHAGVYGGSRSLPWEPKEQALKFFGGTELEPCKLYIQAYATSNELSILKARHFSATQAEIFLGPIAGSCGPLTWEGLSMHISPTLWPWSDATPFLAGYFNFEKQVDVSAPRNGVSERGGDPDLGDIVVSYCCVFLSWQMHDDVASVENQHYCTNTR